jgi:hypothetical protein
MNKKYFFIFISLLISTLAFTQDPGLDEILARHYKALGMDKLLKIKTIVMTGTMIQQDAMPVKIIRMRPNYYLMEFDIQDITAYQVFDGDVAWWTTPWTGNTKPQLMPEDRLKEMRSRADFDGLLFDWKQKGHTLELLGRDSIDNSLYKLKVTKKDGGTEYLFVDTSTFLVQKRLYYRMVRGKEVAMENFFKDYRPVKGVMFAFTQDTHFGGQPYNSLQFDSIEVDQPVETQIFRKPE